MRKTTELEILYRKGIASAIRRLRVLNGITQLQLARQLNITVTTVSHYENAGGSLPAWLAFRMREAYGVDIYTLVHNENWSPPPSAATTLAKKEDQVRSRPGPT